jgi:hypothetical protein
MRILLVVPPKRTLAKDYMKHVPVGLGYLATTLRKLGHEPDIQDCVANRWTSHALLDYITQTKPEIVGLTVFSLAAHTTKVILDLIKQRHPSLTTIVGGPHCTGAPELALQYFTTADYGVAGEGELSLTYLMPILETRSGTLEDVPGLIWRNGTRIRCNPNVEVDRLDELGFPAWDLLDPPQYFDAPGVGDKATPIHTTRGCPYACRASHAVGQPAGPALARVRQSFELVRGKPTGSISNLTAQMSNRLSRTNGEKDLARLRPARQEVGHPRLPHRPGRCVFAAGNGTASARPCALSCPRTLWLCEGVDSHN